MSKILKIIKNTNTNFHIKDEFSENIISKISNSSFEDVYLIKENKYVKSKPVPDNELDKNLEDYIHGIYFYLENDKFKLGVIGTELRIADGRYWSESSYSIKENTEFSLVKVDISLFNKEPDLFEINKNYLPNDGFQRSLEEDKKFLTRSDN